ncbi:NACHT domain-containing protein [Fusarium sp. Ph1]|nr:NACHT domain-containing protein [Fusarium sp. Ph1]
MPKSVKTADEYDFVEHEETAVSPEILAKIREWLQPTDYLADSGEFRRHLASQAPGTGLWICETDEYKKWHDSPDHGSLWIKGVPGAGKSVMAASIIHHLKTTENCPVLFFFFRNIVAANFSPRALIQDWLAQLLPHSPKLQYVLQSRLETKLEETSDNDLIDIFLNGASRLPKLYCVGDALDEMTTENRPFLDKLNSLATHRPQSLKLLITSRPKQHLQSALRDSSIVHISLQQRLVDVDIISYLRHRFDTAVMSEDKLQIKEELIDMVAKRSEGLFLYAKLTMDQIEASLADDGPEDIGALEKSLPIGLEQTYTSMLAKQRQEKGISTDLQVLVLEAVTHSSRPFRLSELASFVKFISADLDAPTGFKDLVVTCCGPLIEILEDETLQVIHHSFTEFLRGDTRTVSKDGASSDFPVIDSLEAHKKMAINCLQYLQSGTLRLRSEPPIISAENLGTRPDENDKESRELWEMHMFIRADYGKNGKDDEKYREARLRHPFLGYAVENWSYHASNYDVKDNEFFDTVQEFVRPEVLAFRRWLSLEWGSAAWVDGLWQDIPTVLHIAAFAGMSELVSELIQKGASVSAQDDRERIPLHWAAENGHAKPLHIAAKKNHASVVTVLLEAGVKPSTGKTKIPKGALYWEVIEGENALLHASQAGHTETVEALIPFCSSEELEQLLCECCRFSRTDSVLSILEKTDVSVNVMCHGGSPLHYACVSANVKCVEALIKRGADLNKMASLGTSQSRLRAYPPPGMTPPLLDLIGVWNKSNNTACRSILKILVKAGVDLDQTSSSGDTALRKLVQPTQRLTGGLYVPALNALLNAGANPKIGDSSGSAPLHIVAARNRSLKGVQLLIEHGADPNQRDSSGRTPFDELIGSFHYDKPAHIEYAKPIIKFFLDNGADPECRDNDGVTPMALGPHKFGPEIFGLLVSKCKSDSTKKECWFGLSREWDMAKFTETLGGMLAAGMEIDQRDENGRTLYLHSLTHAEKRRILKEHGATPGLSDNQGNNAIHLLTAGNRGDRKVLESLFADGLDPLSTNNNGDTLLHHCAAVYHKTPINWKYVRWLLSLGIPVNAVNKHGHTALHVFIDKFCEESKSKEKRTDFIYAINDSSSVDFEIRNNDGLTAIHMAAMRSAVQVFQLVDAGANLCSLTRDSQNVLHLACRARKSNILAQILSHLGNLDVNQADDFGRTPLHYACASGGAESVALLLKHGGNVKAIDSHGCTLLHACAECAAEQKTWEIQAHTSEWMRSPRDPFRPRGSVKYPRRHRWDADMHSKPPAPASAVGTILKLLLDANVDSAVVDQSRSTALDIAIQEGCVEFVEMFYRDEKLFNAATKSLEENHGATPFVDATRRRIKAEMALMLPRSCLAMLEQDKSIFDYIIRCPSRLLFLMPRDDVVKLVDQGFEISPKKPAYYVLLQELMKPGHLQLIERLPHVIAQYGTYEAVKELLSKARVGDDGADMLTPLQFACRESECNMLTIQYLVEKLHVDINVRCAHMDAEDRYDEDEPSPGGTALHILASADRYWQLDAMRYLIAHGADVNALNGKNESPIHVAASGKQNDSGDGGFWRSEAVNILLDHGADLNIVDEEGHTPLHKAADSGDATKQLLHKGADPTVGRRSPVFQAIYHQNLEALEALLDHGLSVNAVDGDYDTSSFRHSSSGPPRKRYPVMRAAFADKMCTSVPGSMPLLRTLVERGADLYLPLNDEETIIQYLFEVPSWYEVSDTLLQEPCVSRIDFNHCDQIGRTVLMAACRWEGRVPGYFERGRVVPKAQGAPIRILDQGADATSVDDDGKTALHHLLDNAAMPEEIVINFINREEVVPTLWLEDNDGFTPFHRALRTLRPSVCSLFLDKGASASEPDPEGLTPLHHIATQCLKIERKLRNTSSHEELPSDYFDQCLSLWKNIIANGGSINATDNAGNTPLHTYLSTPERSSNRRKDLGVCHVDHFDKLFPPDSDVDFSAANEAGETGLHVITLRKKPKFGKPGHDKPLFEVLLGRGVDPLKEDTKGRTALDIASACGKDEIVGVLQRK